MKNDKSTALLNEYDRIVPGGVHSNFRRPVYFKKVQGAYLWDVDGNEYLDCVINNGACILGHGDPQVAAAVTETMSNGLTVGLESELSLEVAKQLHEMIPSAEQVRLANTGTEAVMKALMVARAFTGREKIIKVEGCYHGWFDEAQVSVHPDPQESGPADAPIPVLETSGIRHNTTESVLVVPFNNPESLERTLEANKDQVAAMIIEPVVLNSGCIMPQPGYLAEVRRLTEKYGVLLVFDEVITGFRLAPGGAQELFGAVPDLSTFAKAIANGYSLAALAGRKDLMELTRPGRRLTYGGTYNGQYSALAAASVCLRKLKDGTVQKHLDTIGRTLCRRFEREAAEVGVKARIYQCGGEFQIYFTDREIKDYRDACSADQDSYRIFFETVSDKGLWMSAGYLFHHGLTYAHGEAELDKIITAFRAGLEAVRAFQG